MSILIVILGIAGLTRMPVRELPNVDTAEVTVSVTYTGASPEVVDSEVTTVMEGAIATVPGIERISSEAELSGSRTVVIFRAGRDIDQAAADIRAAVRAAAPNLPEAADAPEVEKNDSQSDPVIWMTMTSDRLSASELTDFAERNVTDRLETVPGVASVNIYGDRPFAMRVWLDPQAMAARRVTVGEVQAALTDNNLALPTGQIETDSRAYLLRAETRLPDVAAFETLTVTERGGAQIALGDVARVDLGVDSDDSRFRANGETAIGLGVLRQSAANTIAISNAIGATVDEISAGLPAGTSLAITSDDADFIENSIRQVLWTLGFAVAIVVGVIFLFLTSVRATLVPAVTIPVALLGACAGIALAGFSINILTLFALILAIGLVVDDAIVVLENIERRMEEGDSPFDAARTGARQVFFAVISTSAALIAVFLPLSFLEGEIGKLFTEFGVTLAIAVAVSTFVALSLCPVIAWKVIKPARKETRFARAVYGLTQRTSDGYRSLLARAIRWPLAVLGVAAFLSGLSWTLYQTLPSTLTPQEDRGIFFVSVSSPTGAALDYTDAAVREVEALIAPYRDQGVVDDVISITEQYGEANRAFLVAVMAPWDARETGPRDVVNELRPAFGEITLASVRAFAPSGLGAGGGGAQLSLNVTAPSFEDAAEWSGEIARGMREAGGIVNVRRAYDLNTPGYDITVNRARAREIGVEARVIAESVRTFFASAEVTDFIDRDRQYPVILQAPDAERENARDLLGLQVRTKAGGLVPLDGLVEVDRRASVRAYERLDRQPTVEISAALAEGTDIGAAIETVEGLADEMPAGMGVAWSGQAETFQETSGGILATFGLALLIVYLVLAAQFESFVQPVVILLSVPLAVAGALITLFVLGEAVNIYAQVGMVMLIGLMAKNGILIVEFANQLRAEGRAVREAVIEASAVRLRPIAMTVLSTVLGAVPLVLSTGAGAESRFSIGVVIIGGFLSASILTLFLTPVLYDLTQRERREPAAQPA
jgi:multidrug efflux pump